MSVDPRDFLGSLRVPVSSFPSVIGGVALLCACNFTWTLRAFDSTGLVLRLLLGVPGFYCFYDFAYGDYGAQGRLTTVGMSVVGLYGMMQILQCAFVGIRDRAPPRWVSMRTGAVQPMPTTITGRALYALDLTTSLRGTSWVTETNWDFAPRIVRAQQQRMLAQGMTRARFLRRALRTLLLQYFVVDAFDTLNKGRRWDTRTLHPVTSLPWLEQLPYTVSVCVGTITAIVVEHNLMALIFVSCGAPVEGWPPMFDSPFSASSLADLWTTRWHSIFRRSFNRLSLAVLWVIPESAGDEARRFVRALAIFCLSAGLHVVFMHRLETNTIFVHPRFLDSSILKFFLVQPLCLALEWLVITPLAHRLLPERWQTVPTRLFVWACLLFTGRYWSDVWVRRGLWGQSEKVVGFSVVRGFWKGQWLVK